MPRATRHLSLVRRVVVQAATEAGFAATEAELIEMAVDEAASNAVLYAQPSAPTPLRLRVRVEARRFEVTLADGGEPFAFDAKGRREVTEQLASSERGGLGIWIMRRFMDEVDYAYTAELGNVITLTKFLPVAG